MAYIVKKPNVKSGKTITIDDFYDLNDIKINGDTKQNTTLGLQLIKYHAYSTPKNNNFWTNDAVYTTPEENGWARIVRDNKNNSSQVWVDNYISSSSIEYKTNTAYTIIYEWKNLQGFASMNLSQSSLNVNPFTENITINFSNPNGITKQLVHTKSTLPNNYLGLRNYFTLPKNTYGIIDVRVMIVEGDYTNQNIEFEYYSGGVISPNPNYSQGIKNVTGIQSIDINGKNFYNTEFNYERNGITVVGTEEYITINGTVTTADAKIDFGNVNLKEGTYTIMNEYLGGIGTASGWIYKTGTWERPAINSLAVNNTLRKAYATFTLTESTNVCFGLYLKNGSTYENNKIRLSIIKSDTPDFNYEPYRPKRTYQINLGNNLFDKNNANILNAYINENGIIANNDTRSLYIPIDSNTTYTIQKYGSARFRVGTTKQKPDVGSTLLNYQQLDSDGSITINTLNEANYLVVYFYATFDTNTKTQEEVLNTIQIEKGNMANEYSTYFEPIELCKIGNYQDYIYKQDNKWYLHKEIGKYIVDENDVSIDTDYPNVNYGVIPKQIDDILYNTYDRDLTCIASFAVNASGIRPWGLIDSIDKIMGDAMLYEYWIGFSKNSTLQDIKNQINNQLLYYVLKEPTDTEITNETLIKQLNNVDFIEGLNIVDVTSNNYNGELVINYNYKDNDYYNAIYSGDSKHKIKILFDGVELEDADRYCEKLTRKPRILPDDGSKRFSLDNFVSQEIELILHNIDTSIIKDKVEIQIGTVVGSNSLGDIYEYVPLGIFNIQDEPITDKDKITLTLRDNAVLFDFGYNAKPLMDANDGVATKMQILQDICNQAGVVCSVQEFKNMNDELGTYDNTITGRMYVAYLAEQAGAIATINRNGELIFVYVNDLKTQKIPLNIVEKYEIGDEYQIKRVVYEDAIRKFETSNDESLDTLYINSANPFINNQTQIDEINNIVNGFKIDSLTTGKILGDPSIDGYDIIEIYGYYDDNNEFVDDDTKVVARTFANHTSIYNGALTNTYDTQIGKEERTDNVTLSGEGTFQKYARTSIDNINNDIKMVVAEQNEQSQQMSQTIMNINNIQNLFQITGGNNMIKDSQLLLGDEGIWEYQSGSIGTSNYIGGYDATLIGKTVAVAKIGLSNIKMTSTSSNITNLIINEMYTLSYKISNDDNTITKVKLIGNGNVIYEQTFNSEIDMEEQSFSFITSTSNYTLEIETSSQVNGYAYIYDLILNKGDTQNWQPASGEIVSTTIKLSRLGVNVYSTGSEIATLLTGNGFQIRRFQNSTIYEVVTSFDKDGFISKKGKMEELQLKNFDFRTINYHSDETLILYKRESDD